MDAKEFFDVSAGQWLSMRTTHHLPFRRAEGGGSQIDVRALAADDPQVAEICGMHDVDPATSIGGARVVWNGSMAWDKEGENHTGSTVFALIPDAGDPRRGKLLRERGYAEIVPVAGRYEMDEDDSLVLLTEYDSTNVFERFWFASPNMRMRVSTAQRFGGFSTATFCVELRSSEPAETPNAGATPATSIGVKESISLFGW